MEANLGNSCSSSSSSSSSSSEDYINMEVDSSRSIFRHSSSAKEFEFQSFSSSSDRDHTTTSPADELFYMGKLLPLHLPPRLEMVHKILQNPPKNQPFYEEEEEEESFNTPIFTPTSNTTPFESCNVSPNASCQVSMELDSQEYFVEYLAGIHQEKKSWTRKLRLIKQTRNIGSKLKSLFTKSSVGCSNEYSAHIAADHRQGINQCSNPHSKAVKREEKLAGDFRGGGGHRRSFSAAFKHLSKAKTLPPGVGSDSCTVDDVNRHGLMKRSCSSSTELESPIQAAIAHCKSTHQQQQQQRLYSTTQIGADEIRFCPNSARDDEERSWLWR